MTHVPSHPQAIVAIRAAAMRRTIGHWAAWRYCAKRGCPHSLFVIALVLQEASSAGL